MKYEEFNRLIAKNMIAHPRWRYGQAVFNTLYDLEPERADEIRGTRMDPFHALNNDLRLARFWDWFMDNWD
jgi:hypothetical protein